MKTQNLSATDGRLLSCIVMFLLALSPAFAQSSGPIWQITYTKNGSTSYSPRPPGGISPRSWTTTGPDYAPLGGGGTSEVTASGTITATLRWVYSNGSPAPNPPLVICVLETTSATWSVGLGSQMTATATGDASTGCGDPYFMNSSGLSGGATGAHYRQVNSASGTVTLSATLNSYVRATAIGGITPGSVVAQCSYTVSIVSSHPHPRNFHKDSQMDLGNGEERFRYLWESDDGDLNHLANCVIYEFVTYNGNEGTYGSGTYTAPNPPFDNWVFSNPLRGSAIPATGGILYDWIRRENFNVPLAYYMRNWTITSVQQYRYHCNLCGADEVVSGVDNQNIITRVFDYIDPYEFCLQRERRWKYSATKHGFTVWLIMDYNGRIADSSGNLYR